MTKIYLKPETEIIKVELQLMQQTSLGKDASEGNKVTNEEDVLGKEFSFSFFEEEVDDEE